MAHLVPKSVADAPWFLSLVHPHQPLTRDRLSSLTKEAMAMCGVDMLVYTVHATKGAAVSMYAKLQILSGLVHELGS